MHVCQGWWLYRQNREWHMHLLCLPARRSSLVMANTWPKSKRQQNTFIGFMAGSFGFCYWPLHHPKPIKLTVSVSLLFSVPMKVHACLPHWVKTWATFCAALKLNIEEEQKTVLTAIQKWAVVKVEVVEERSGAEKLLKESISVSKINSTDSIVCEVSIQCCRRWAVVLDCRRQRCVICHGHRWRVTDEAISSRANLSISATVWWS